MVIRSDLKVELVDAESKKPFKEHEKDGNIYVEVEPDMDYFIAIRRWHLPNTPHQVHRGFWSRVNGQGQDIALQFTKPRPSNPGTGYEGITGKVEVRLFEGIPEGILLDYDFIDSVDPDPTLEGERANISEKKFLLSEKGYFTSMSEFTGAKTVSDAYSPGKFIDSITLHYCTAVGLIEVGVLPKPQPWDYHRMKFPVRAGQQTALHKPMKHPRLEKLIEVVDL
ncbi:hypothetical protein MPSEU_000189000 [Mayamaea pseudoterrestris]|nr:hypothetical protein MPSEU_000189000 [Mayamaea pseudoterrestris]